MKRFYFILSGIEAGWGAFNENIWLSQKRIAELFGCTSDNISLHLKNIYQERELDTAATAEEFSVVQQEGNRDVARTVTCYSLEAIAPNRMWG